MIRWILVSTLLATVAGCQQVEDSSLRFGKDLFVTVTSPVNAPVAAVKDTYRFVRDEGAGVQLFLFVPILGANLFKHTLVVLVHPLDACLYPFYLPLGLKPMHHYTIDAFPYTTADYVDQFFAEPLESMDTALSESESRARRGDPDRAPVAPTDFFDVP